MCVLVGNWWLDRCAARFGRRPKLQRVRDAGQAQGSGGVWDETPLVVHRSVLRGGADVQPLRRRVPELNLFPEQRAPISNAKPKTPKPLNPKP